jgi:N-acetylglucosaminyl-diphospho-decaprenol L-rhamnosyltransferase
MDSWPHTSRVLPWIVAAFLVMVFWIPFDSTTLPVSLPINSDLDRFVIGGMFLIWLVVLLGRSSLITFRATPMNTAIYGFLAAAFASIVVNLPQLAWDGELTLSVKELSLILSYLVAFYVIATSVRPSEVAAYSRLIVFLAVGTAVGTVYQYVSGSNPFFFIAKTIFVGAHVQSSTAAVEALSGPGSRPSITGPALHGLADASLISTAIPFCVCFASTASRRHAKVGWWIAMVTLLAGCFATGRKTALIVVAAAFLVMVFYEPRRYRVFLWTPIIAAGCLFIIAPHAIEGLFYQVSNASSSPSTAGRTADYGPVIPDIYSHLLIGRGYGSYDQFKYRILDDQMLGWIVSIGVFGAAAYVLMIVASVLTVHHVARRPQILEDRLMQAVAAASVGYLTTNFTYDTFGFRQAPYSFFIVAALGVVYAGRRRSQSGGVIKNPAPVVMQAARSMRTLTASLPTASPQAAAFQHRLSLLIVTYRNPALTRECLAAVNAAVKNIDAEVLVLDNASPDGVADMIRAEFPWVDLDASAENLGFAKGNNVLAGRAQGEFILLLNPDAILHDGALEAILSFAQQHPQAGIYGGRTLRPSGEVDPSSCWGFQTVWSLVCFATGLSRVFKRTALFDPESLGAWTRDSVRQVDVVTGCFLLIRAELWRDLGGFDEEFWMYGEDQDLAVRAYRRGYRPLITPDAVVTHVVGASSSTGNKNVLVLGSRVRLMRKYWWRSKVRVGIVLLWCGCGVRAFAADRGIGWRESWNRRREWMATGL